MHNATMAVTLTRQEVVDLLTALQMRCQSALAYPPATLERLLKLQSLLMIVLEDFDAIADAETQL